MEFIVCRQLILSNTKQVGSLCASPVLTLRLEPDQEKVPHSILPGKQICSKGAWYPGFIDKKALAGFCKREGPHQNLMGLGK